MAPKKKSKVNKLAKMSDEERARYLQHRADIEEEARRRKQELISRYMNNKLNKEETFSKINTAKLNQTWRLILRKIKCNQLTLEIQGLVSTFDFMVDRKNYLLSSLMKAIDEADDQHRRMIQAHMETINQFLEIGSDRLINVQGEYDTQKNILLEDWDKEYYELTGNHDKAEFKLQLLMFQKNEDMAAYKKQKEHTIATAKNDARLLQEQRILELSRGKELEIESYWNQLRAVYMIYMEQHSPIMGHYSMLKEKDDFYKRDIARNADKIACMHEILLSLQKEWIRSNSRITSKFKKTQHEKEESSRKYWQLKKNTKGEQHTANERLIVMVNASEHTIQTLEQVKEKLHKIQQLAQICSKYETEDERRMMLPSSHGSIGVIEYQNLDDDMITECEDLKKLDKFLLKVNRVRVQNTCLRSERDKLNRENEQLKNYMKKQMTELALQSGKNQSRPNSMKFYKTDAQKIEALNLRSSWNNRPLTCIEGVLSNAVLHERRMKLQESKNKALGEVRAYPRVCWQHQ